MTKQDKHYVTSADHTPLDNSPLTRAAVRAKKGNGNNFTSSSTTTKRSAAVDLFQAKKKQPRLDINHFFQLVIANKVKNDLDLCVIAKKQMDEGKMDLSRFVMSRTERQREDLIKNAWKIENSMETLNVPRRPTWSSFRKLDILLILTNAPVSGFLLHCRFLI